MELGISHFPKWDDKTVVTPEDIIWNEPVNRYDERHGRYITGRPSQGYGTHDFEYAGKNISPLPWEASDKILDLKGRLEDFVGVKFYFCLAGLYESNEVGIPMHHDEIESPTDVIVSLSYGATRIFELQPIDGSPLQRFVLEEGDLVIMTGRNQELCQHGVPELETPCGPRVNLTFRTKGTFA